jgi:hypothetical protein
VKVVQERDLGSTLQATSHIGIWRLAVSTGCPQTVWK